MYMPRVVEEVAKTFDSRLRVEKVVTKTFAGARRYMSLVRLIGRQLPVPSIIINEAIAFDITPPVETLKAYLDTVIGQPR